MVRYPASAARRIFIFGPVTIAKDRPDKFGIRPMLGRWSIPTWDGLYAYLRLAELDFSLPYYLDSLIRRGASLRSTRRSILLSLSYLHVAFAAA